MTITTEPAQLATTALPPAFVVPCPEWCTDEPGHIWADDFERGTTRVVPSDGRDDAMCLHHEHHGPTFGDLSKYGVGVIGSSEEGRWFYDVDMPAAIEDQAGLVEEERARELLANLQSALAWIEARR